MAENELNEVIGDVPAIPAEEPAPPAEPETPPATPPVDDPPDPTSVQAEIDTLEATRKKAEEDARYWRRQKAEARKDYFTKPETPPATPPAETDFKKPDPAGYDDYNDYVDALTDYKADVRIQQWDRDQAKKAQDSTHNERMGRLQAEINKGFEKYEDFEDVALDPAVPITPVVHEILAESNAPADVAYYLGKNRTEAIQISRMTPIAAARAIAKIETQLASGQPPPPKKTTQAPPPIKPVGNNAPATHKDPEKMTQKEYNEYRREQGARPY